MSQPRIFVSHSSTDKPFADALVYALREAGADVWYDEESLGAGHLRRTIMQELSDRPVFMVLLSKAALASQWVQDECEWAYDLQRGDHNRVLLPVVVEPLVWADLNMALYLRGLKRVEAGDLRPLSIDDSIKQTLRLLGLNRVSQDSPPAVSPAKLPAHAIPIERFPDKLANLGYEGRLINEVEVILPPLCLVLAGPFLMGSGPSVIQKRTKRSIRSTL